MRGHRPSSHCALPITIMNHLTYRKPPTIINHHSSTTATITELHRVKLEMWFVHGQNGSQVPVRVRATRGNGLEAPSEDSSGSWGPGELPRRRTLPLIIICTKLHVHFTHGPPNKKRENVEWPLHAPMKSSSRRVAPPHHGCTAAQPLSRQVPG